MSTWTGQAHRALRPPHCSARARACQHPRTRRTSSSRKQRAARQRQQRPRPAPRLRSRPGAGRARRRCLRRSSAPEAQQDDLHALLLGYARLDIGMRDDLAPQQMPQGVHRTQAGLMLRSFDSEEVIEWRSPAMQLTPHWLAPSERDLQRNLMLHCWMRQQCHWSRCMLQSKAVRLKRVHRPAARAELRAVTRATPAVGLPASVHDCQRCRHGRPLLVPALAGPI